MPPQMQMGANPFMSVAGGMQAQQMMGQPNPMMMNPGAYNTMQPQQPMGPGMYNTMAAGANPFMMQQSMPYQNPQHNQRAFKQDFTGSAFDNKGPSQESWQRDVHEFGFDVKLNVQANKNENDEIKEF